MSSWSIFWLVLLGIPSGNQLPITADAFHNYHQGLRAAKEAGKPMLVVMNPGAQETDDAITLVSIRKTRERRSLLEDYVVVFVDTTTRHGRIVHKAYEHPELPHVVILGKRQKYQIFTTSGQMYGQRWTEILKRYRRGVRIRRRRTTTYCPT